MDHQNISGRIDYVSLHPETKGQWRGGDSFHISKHRGGRRTLRARCMIDENSPRVLRDTIVNLDPDWTPLGGFVQISVDDAHVGCAWYDFSDGYATAEGLTVREGRFSQRIKLAERPAFFGNHALQADAFTTRCYDLSQGPGHKVLPYFLMCSTNHRGADGPTLVPVRNFDLYFIGEEEVTVTAGTFQGLHFRIGDSVDGDYIGSDRHPPYHIWVTADGDFLLLKAHITGYMQSYYELVELARDCKI